jgi:hypothetical protein
MEENELIGKRRVRRRTKELEGLAREFISSGMKRMEFCREHRLGLQTLQRHLSRAEQNAKRERRLVEVELEDQLEPRGCTLQIVLAGGRRIEVGPGFDGSTLEEIIAVLERS